MEREELVKEVVDLHHRLTHIMRQQTPDSWMKLNLTVPQLKSLFFMTDNGATNFKELASVLKVTPSNLTGVIDRLVDHGLVTRAENAADRRVIILKATKKGQNLVTGLRERRLNHLSKALSGFDSDELQVIIDGLSLLVKATERQSV
jgi:MarR family transcriptional regulator, organic hydroperoxide resistance regulator